MSISLNLGDKMMEIKHWIELLKQEVQCPICLQPFVDPVTTRCFHTFCMKCIAPILATKSSCCPLCKKKIARRGILENKNVKRTIQKVLSLCSILEDESCDERDVYSCHGDATSNVHDEVEKKSCGLDKISRRKDQLCRSETKMLVPENITEKESKSKVHELSLMSGEGKGSNSTSPEESTSSIVDSCSNGYLSASKRIPSNQNTYSRRSSNMKISTSLAKKRVVRYGDPKPPENKVKEWLVMNDVDGCSPPVFENLPNPKNDRHSSELNLRTESNEICLNKLEKRVSCGLAHDGETVSSCVASRKPEISGGEEDGIPDSCPVEVNNTFDKLVSEARKSYPKPGVQAHDKSIPEAAPSDICLFDSLPLQSENVLCSSLDCVEDSSPQPVSKLGGRLSRESKDFSYKRGNKRSLSTNKNISVIRKNNQSISKEMNLISTNVKPVENREKRDESPKSKVDLEKKMVGNSYELSTQKLDSIHDTPEMNEDREGSPKFNKKKSDLNTSHLSPGWSRLRSARKDFQNYKKVAGLPALEVSGGVPCSAAARSHPMKRTSNFPEIMCLSPPVNIDDTGSCQTDQNASNRKSTPLSVGCDGQNSALNKSNICPPSKNKLSLEGRPISKGTVSPLHKVCAEVELASKKVNTPEKVVPVANKSIDKGFGTSAIMDCSASLQCHKDPKVSMLSSLNEAGKVVEVIGEQANPSAKTPTNILLEANKLGQKGTETCEFLKRVASPKALTLSQIPATNLGDVCDKFGNPVGNVGGKENVLKTTANPVNKIRSQLDDDDDCKIIVESPLRKKFRSNLSNSIAVERKTFSLNASTEDLNELASLRESTEDQLAVFEKDLVGLNSPESLENELNKVKNSHANMACGDQVKNRDSIQKSTGEDKDGHSKIGGLGQSLERSKTFHVKNLQKRSRLSVPMFKMGRLNRKRSYSRRRVSFYILGNVRHGCGAAQRSFDVGISAGTSDLRSSPHFRLSDTPKPPSTSYVEAGIQTSLSLENWPWNSSLGKSPQPSQSNLLSKLPVALDEELQGESLDLIPNTERSGPVFPKPGTKRNIFSRRPACRLFPSYPSINSQNEMALPLQSKNGTVCGSPKNSVVYLSSGDDSEHESEEIQKNLFLRRCALSQRKLKDNVERIGIRKRRTSLSKRGPMMKDGPSWSSNDCVAEMDSELLEEKLMLIVANIDADMNIGKKRKASGEYLEHNTSGPVRDVTNEDNERENVDSNSVSVVMETNPLSLTYVEDSDSSELDFGKEKELLSEKGTDPEELVEKNPSQASVKDSSGDESNCIIEGSQIYVENLEKSICPPERQISLVASGLPRLEVNQVKQFARTFNVYFSSKFCGPDNELAIPSTSHVITKTYKSGRAESTFKYLCGVVSGCWVLSLSWIRDSLAAGKLLDEEKYEVLDVNGSDGPQRGRNSNEKLFDGFEFYCIGAFTNLVPEEIEVILKLGGGKVFSKVEDFSKKRGKQIVMVEGPHHEVKWIDTFGEMAALDLVVVSSDWMIESIGEYKIQSLVNHVVNLGDKDSTYIDLRERLLAMGYDEDLVGFEVEQSQSLVEDVDCTESQDMLQEDNM